MPRRGPVGAARSSRPPFSGENAMACFCFRTLAVIWSSMAVHFYQSQHSCPFWHRLAGPHRTVAITKPAIPPFHPSRNAQAWANSFLTNRTRYFKENRLVELFVLRQKQRFFFFFLLFFCAAEEDLGSEKFQKRSLPYCTTKFHKSILHVLILVMAIFFIFLRFLSN